MAKPTLAFLSLSSTNTARYEEKTGKVHLSSWGAPGLVNTQQLTDEGKNLPGVLWSEPREGRMAQVSLAPLFTCLTLQAELSVITPWATHHTGFLPGPDPLHRSPPAVRMLGGAF